MYRPIAIRKGPFCLDFPTQRRIFEGPGLLVGGDTSEIGKGCVLETGRRSGRESLDPL